jgi:hypothetical protein
VTSDLVAPLLSGALILTVAVALLSKKVSTSLIALFYAAVVLGVTFTVYGDALLGLLTMVTFAGAVSVLLLTVILITGESRIDMGARKLAPALISLAAVVGVASFYALFAGPAGEVPTSDTSLNVFAFAWNLRPWDLLILVVVLAAGMVAVTGLLGSEK